MISAEFERTDPLSSSPWSKRQTGYARPTNLGGEYTPQMVIGGGWRCDGSDARSIERAVAAARSTPQLGRTSIQTNLAAERLQIKISAQLLSAASTGSRVVILAIYENGLVSKIGAGENGDRENTYDYTLGKCCPHLNLTRRGALLSAGKSQLTSTHPGQ
jgi:hypothetical protein